jgi:hypothetical protein
MLLPVEERPWLLTFHDESCSKSKDESKSGWSPANVTVVYGKSDGQSYMVSGFVNCVDGLFACEYITVAKDNYWTSDQFIPQVERTVEDLEARHPWAQHLFLFDHSMNHKKRAPDQLSAFSMNKGHGGAVPNMRTTTWTDSDGQEHKQELTKVCFCDACKKSYTQQYWKAAVRAAGKWVVGKSAKETVYMADAKALPNYDILLATLSAEVQARTDHPPLVPRGLEEILRERKLVPGASITEKAARALLAAQPDFLNAESILEERFGTGPNSGRFKQSSMMMIPKFHCELNPIEHVWCWCKRQQRDFCTSDTKMASFRSFVERLPGKLPLHLVQRWFGNSFRWLLGYEAEAKKDADGDAMESNARFVKMLIKFSGHRYKSHRRAPQPEDCAEITDAFEQTCFCPDCVGDAYEHVETCIECGFYADSDPVGDF